MSERRRSQPDLPAAEAERVGRRERQRTAAERELMRTGQAKAFKQILDVQAKRASEAERLSREAGQRAGGAKSSGRRRSG